MSKALRPQRGAVLIDGQPLLTINARKLAQKLAVISSEQHFEFPFSVADVVAMGRFPHLEPAGENERPGLEDCR
jgi:iron complex transport system ATP-binding protein